MRRPLTTSLAAALAIAFLGSSSWAQSGTTGILPSAPVANAVQALSQLPTVTATPMGSVPMASAPALQMEPMMGQSMSLPTMAAPTMSAPMMSSPMMSSPAMAYSGPVTGAYNPGPASSSYGPVSVGPYPQGRACCDLSPTPTVTPCLKPVTSCCSQNGRLGVPPLLTPIRNDMPPVGKAVGRPLFGKWTGF